MKLSKIAILCVLFIFIQGCAAPKVFVQKAYIPTSADSFEFRLSEEVAVPPNAIKIFSEQLKESLSKADLDKGEANNLVDITFTSYNMRHGAARALLGVFAGNDYVVTQVVIKHKGSEKAISELRVISQNNKAMGTTQGLLEMHADKIVAYLKTGKT